MSKVVTAEGSTAMVGDDVAAAGSGYFTWRAREKSFGKPL